MSGPENIILELRKFVAPEFVFGAGARKLAGTYVENLGGRRVLLVTDPGVIAAGWVKDVIESLDERGIHHTLFCGVSPNPRDYEVMAGALLYQKADCNAIVAVGGGSPIDCAKGIGIVASNHLSILDFKGVDRVPKPTPPLVCIPTTGGTSADVSQFAIVTDTTQRVKVAIISKSVVPDMALIDPVTLTTMDPFLTACTGMDALVHAMEAYVSNASSHFTDLHALEAVRLISSNLEASVANPADLELRGAIMMGSLEAGLAFSNASLGCVHALAHSLGGYLDLPHGECNAMLLPHVVEFNFEASPQKFIRIGQAFGMDLRRMSSREAKAALLAEIHRLRAVTGIAKTLGERGLRSCDVPVLAEKAMADPCMVTNPREAKERDIEVIYEEAM